MKKLIQIFSALVLFCCLFAGTFTIPNWVINSVVFIMVDNKPIGSGFLLGIEQSGKQFIYLVSAKHVLEPILSDTTKPLNVRFNKKDGSGAVTVTFPTQYFNGKRWIEHKNPAVDIAAVPLAIWDKINELDVGLFLVADTTKDYFCDTSFVNKYKVTAGDQVFTVGSYPIFLIKMKRIWFSRVLGQYQRSHNMI